jgi:hypothetical protein
MPVLVNSGVYHVRLLGRRWLDKHHRPQSKAGEPLDESQDRAGWLRLHWAVV